MKTHFELRKAHTQGSDPIIKGRTTKPLISYLMKRKADPFSYDIEKWVWDGKDWSIEYFTGDEILKATE